MKKFRLILDCRVSGSNDHATQSERILLPGAWHILSDVLELRADPGQVRRLFVCDFSDAFFMAPLEASEQKYFVTSHQGKYYLWLRVAQGSINGPNLFGRLSALIGRCSQGLFNPTELRLHIYQDDPCAALVGTEEQCKRNVCILIAVWVAFGFNLVAHKAQ